MASGKIRFPEWPFPEKLDSFDKVQEFSELMYVALVEDGLQRTEDLNTTDINTIGAIAAPTLEGTTSITSPAITATTSMTTVTIDATTSITSPTFILEGGTYDTTINAGTPSASITYVFPPAAPTVNKQVWVSDIDGTGSWTSVSGIAGATIISLTDTFSSHTAKKLLVTNEAGNATALASNAVWDETSDRLEVTSSNPHCIKAIRSTAETQLVGSCLMLKKKTSADMVGLYGAGLTFAIEDDTSGESVIGNIACVRDGADNSGRMEFELDKAGVSATRMRLTKDSNVLIGSSTEATSCIQSIHMYNGTAPSASVPDGFVMYSKDITGGNAAAHFRTEGGAVVKLYQQTAIGDSSGDDSAAVNAIKNVLVNAGMIAST